MSYFINFPLIQYSIATKNIEHEVPNIFKRIKMKKGLENNFSLFDKIHVPDGDTPEILADKIYGDPFLHWVLLIVNNITDPFYDWPVSDEDVLEFTKKKYGVDKVFSVHHWEDSEGFQVLSSESGAVSVTNLEHETKLNDDKRFIRILKPQFLTEFVNEFNFLLNS